MCDSCISLLPTFNKPVSSALHPPGNNLSVTCFSRHECFLVCNSVSSWHAHIVSDKKGALHGSYADFGMLLPGR